MRLSVVLARAGLFLFIGFGILINQFTKEKIENFLTTVPYRCPLRWITGWKCAFCGMTHSWIALFRGNGALSFHENIFGPPLWVAALLTLLIYSMNKKITYNLKPAFSVTIGLMVIYAVTRNIF